MNWLNLVWMLVVVASLSWIAANLLVITFAPLARTSTDIGVRKHLWLMAALPWALPVVAVVSLLLLALAKSQGWIYDHCETHVAHHPHFCFEHLPEIALKFSNSLAGLIAVFGPLTLFFYRIAPQYGLYAQSKFFQRLVSDTGLKKTLSDDRPLAFTLGCIKPSIFISRGLTKLLNRRQMRMVVKHEIAHIRNKDILKNTLFEFLLSLHFFPKLLRSSWYLSSEIRADAYAAKQFDSLEIADVLVKLRRVGVNSPFPASISGGQLSQRISLLLNDNQNPIRTPSAISFLYLAVIAFPIILLLGHHGLETLWGWLQ